MIPRGNQTTIINKLNGKKSEQRFFQCKGSISILGSLDPFQQICHLNVIFYPFNNVIDHIYGYFTLFIIKQGHEHEHMRLLYVIHAILRGNQRTIINNTLHSTLSSNIQPVASGPFLFYIVILQITYYTSVDN